VEKCLITQSIKVKIQKKADNTKRRAVLPNEKHEFSRGWQAAQKGEPAGCTTGRASGLHIKAGCRKGWAGGLPFSAGRPVFFRSPPDRPFLQPALLSSVQPVENSRFSFRNMAL